jgi:hypothetical protein
MIKKNMIITATMLITGSIPAAPYAVVLPERTRPGMELSYPEIGDGHDIEDL